MPQNHQRIPRFRYLGYAALYQAKKAAGLRADRHRNFLIWKLVKLMESGKINGGHLGITSMGKTDGVGAQAMAKFSAMAIAHAYGMQYVHVPFKNLAHAELPGSEWDGVWEQLLAMNAGAPPFDPENMKPVGLGEFLGNPALWKRKVVIFDRHFHPFCELAPNHGCEVAGKLQASFGKYPPEKPGHHVCRIGVHVRRGDVRKGDTDTNHRFTPNGHTVAVLRQVIEAAVDSGLEPEIHLHSNGTIDELGEFRQCRGIEYHTGSPALDT
ncbi:MAG: hypothetical protein ACO3RV_06805, partial [Luteolibacter sp.]